MLRTDFLKNLSRPPKVIFFTAYRDYAVEGYELNAVDYSVRPVSFESFVKAITKVKEMPGLETLSQTNDYKFNPEAFVYFKADKNRRKAFIK